jgi:hypothetical protein
MSDVALINDVELINDVATQARQTRSVERRSQFRVFSRQES